MRTFLLTAALVLATVSLPAASACIQVYPWSELCQGDVEGFQEAVVDDDVCYQEPSHVTRCRDLTQMVKPRAGPDCIQVYPWSELCEGDVEAFVCYYAHCDAILAP